MAQHTGPHALSAGAFLAVFFLVPAGAAAQSRDVCGMPLLQAPGAVEDSQAVVEFQLRLQRYDDLRRRLDSSLPVQAISSDPAAISEVVKAHQTALRAARSGNVHGDVFFREIADLIRIRIRGYLHGVSPRAFLETISEADAPQMARPCVNGAYPADAAVTTMPARLLQVLPSLPRGVEYRFVDRDLILWDPHANLIIDFIPAALCDDR